MFVPENHPLYRVVPTLDDVKAICRPFRIGPVVSVEADLGGQFNVNLKVATAAHGAYVLRVHSGLATDERLNYIQTVVEELYSHGIPVVVPLTTEEGRSFVTYRGRHVQVTPYVHGRVFSDLPEQVRSSGKMLRRLHEVLRDFPDGPIPPWSNYPSKTTLEKGLHHLDTETCGISQSQRGRARRLYQMVMTEWDRYSDRPLTQTVIHGDWHFLNSLYDDNGDITAVLDFDFAARAERLHDVAYALWILLSQPALRPMARSFLEGYGALTKQEEELLPTAIARAALFFVCTASFVPNPARELEVQLAKQEPFIEWACSEDGRRFISSCVPHT